MKYLALLALAFGFASAQAKCEGLANAFAACPVRNFLILRRSMLFYVI